MTAPVRLIPRPQSIVEAIEQNWAHGPDYARPIEPYEVLRERAEPPVIVKGGEQERAYMAGLFALLAAVDATPAARVKRLDIAKDQCIWASVQTGNEASKAFYGNVLDEIARWRAAVVRADLDLAGQHAAEGRRATG